MTEQDKVVKALKEMGPGYELVRELGRGTTAIVYLVRDHELERDLAVKVIRSTFAHDEEAVARLKREARMVAQLQHPNIVRVFSTRHFPDGTLALLMEHVPGRDLKEVLRATGPFQPDRALEVLRDVASALAYAHRRRIVHRDVKPENIYVDDEVGTARLADFGIARPWDRDARLTIPGEALGTPAYMSPEQIDGKDVDGRTDVYSLGLVGYEMLAGEHPWEGDSLFNIIYKQKNDDLPPLRQVRPGLPGELVDVVERAIRKDRSRRWDSADAILERLDTLRRTPLGAAPPAADGGAPARPGRPAAGAAAARLERPPPPVDEGPGVTPDPAPGRQPVRWRRDRLALVAAGLAAMAVVGAWSLNALGGDDDEWTTLDGAEAGAPRGTEGASPPSAGGLGESLGSSDLQVVRNETPEEGPVGGTVTLVLRPRDGTDPSATARLRVVEGGGVLASGVAAAGADGAFRTTLHLPDRPGITTVAAGLEGGGDEIRLDVAARAGPPARVLSVVGDHQVADAGSLLPEDPGVRVLDALGNPVSGIEVQFQVVEGEGLVAPSRARTDTAGRAFARWRLGSSTGEQRMAALVPSAGNARVVFQAVGRGLTTGDPDPVVGSPPPTPPVTGGDAGGDSVSRTPPAGVSGEPPPPSEEAAGGAPRVAAEPLAVGGTHVCAIGARGFARCLGPLRGATGDGGIRFASLASGFSHVCGLESTGEAWCWGSNGSGQLGDGSRADRDAPTPVETSSRFSALALGLSHTCGLDASGRPHCWGRNVNGQVGDGSRDDRAVPRPVAGAEGMVELTAGWNHTCGLSGSGRAWCWGLNSDGQLGDGSRVDRLTPAAVSGGGAYTALAAGSSHTCGLGGGAVRCWGDDGNGQLGSAETGSQSQPVPVEGLPDDAVQLAAGAAHTCALLQGGQVWCWGQNMHGQLGDGSTTDRGLPVPISGDFRFRSLDAGGGSTCGVTNDGSRYCWGFNQNGQLGDGTRTNRSAPARVGG